MMADETDPVHWARAQLTCAEQFHSDEAGSIPTVELRVLMDAYDRLAEVEAERDQLKGIIHGDPEVMKLHYEGGSLEMALKHPMVLAQVWAWRSVLDAGNAENYVESQFHDVDRDDPQVYIVTVQRKHGKTPHALRVEAEERLAAVRAHYLAQPEEGYQTTMRELLGIEGSTPGSTEGNRS